MIINADARFALTCLPDQYVNCCVTSPPYFGLRDYGADGQIGLEETPDAYVAEMVSVFREVRRVLRDDGTLWLNIGDSYAGGGGGNYGNGKSVKSQGGQQVTNVRNRKSWMEQSGLKSKDLIGIPWMLAFALREDGWYLRQDIIWHKPNAMPESVTDRCVKSHEYVFLFSKSPKYHFDYEAIKEDTVGGTKGSGASSPTGTHRENRADVGYDGTLRNRRSVWTVATKPFHGAHFATFPYSLVEPCILAGCPEGGRVLDPFFGAGTTGLVATELGREYLGIELNPEYVEISKRRLGL